MKGLAPDHNTIANFRKDNSKAIRKIFHVTVVLAKNFDLIGAKLLAGDSTRLRAQNATKNNFNPGKIERHIAYLDDKLAQYNNLLAQQDNDLTEAKKAAIQEKINKHKQHKGKYQNFQEQIGQTGAVQISTSDPESRQLITRNNITEVAYNVQTTVDARHNIPIDFKVTNQNDSKAMGAMVRRGFYYIMTKKTIKHASADVGLIFVAFNLHRIFNIIDTDTLKTHLRVLVCFFFAMSSYFQRLCAIVILMLKKKQGTA